MSTKKIIIAGIGTEVGKTVTSAIITQKLKADYWKPVQAGDLHQSDTIKVKNWLSNEQTTFHEEAFRLTEPMSPHAAADIDGITIKIDDFKTPETDNNLVIELAGGLLVPLNHSDTNLELIQHLGLPVVLVVNFYLGSINHTLLSVSLLKTNNILIEGLLFNGEVNSESKQVILEMTGCTDLGTIPKIEGEITSDIIDSYGQFIQI